MDCHQLSMRYPPAREARLRLEQRSQTPWQIRLSGRPSSFGLSATLLNAGHRSPL